ncbi:MAG: EAL domain-containing protein [Acidithiobacillus ferrooxidans]|uniref:CZB domain-containing protein n=1 Tax=Acidithiobacillus ferrooxidans TaxID=920 RepID=UPI000FAB25E0|nr:EAL domain-containing protein [Acidithiobacillus ferrooxidans]RRN83939.1 MAG: EAL domain-containing protein [Acidithiobacillus ferrooxidans]
MSENAHTPDLTIARLPADSIKIDQSFVRDVIDDPKDLAIVTAVITASRMLGMNVIAEGVETADHVDLLVKTGCNHLQGYFFSKPIPAEDVPAWVAHFRPAPRTKDSLHPLNILSPILEGHILRVQKFIGALRQENPFPAHVIEKDAEEYCHLGLWLRGEGKQRFGATPQFMRLLTRHERLHQVARVAKLHFDAGDADGAMEQGKLLDMENGLLLAELLAMAGESRDNI